MMSVWCSLQWLPMFKVLEPAKVVGNQMEALTSRTSDDDDSLFVGTLREQLWWSRTAHLTGEDDTELLAQRDSKLWIVAALRFFFLFFNWMTGLWWCRSDRIFNRCSRDVIVVLDPWSWFCGYWSIITDITWCCKIKARPIQQICEMLFTLNWNRPTTLVVLRHYEVYKRSMSERSFFPNVT